MLSNDTTPDSARRDVLKTAGLAVTGGALGSLAGCAGEGDGGDGGGDGGDGGGADGGDGGDGGGGQESVTIEYWAHFPTNIAVLDQAWTKAMKTFEEQNSNISITPQRISSSELQKQIVRAVLAGNYPDFAEMGSTAIRWLGNEVVDHTPMLEGASWFSDMSPAFKEEQQFRGQYFGGSPDQTIWMMGLVPEYFKGVGIEDPATELETHTQFHQALQAIKEKYPDVVPFGTTATAPDVEPYWAEARTAYTGTTDPFINGEGDTRTVNMGQNPRTDGQLKANLKRGQMFSSQQRVNWGNENVIPLMANGQVASYFYETGGSSEWLATDPDITFGWDGGAYAQKLPRVDPDYGATIGVPELEGMEGTSGGHMLLWQHSSSIMNTDASEETWKLFEFMHTSEEYNLSTHAPGVWTGIMTYTPLNEVFFDMYQSEMTQLRRASFESFRANPEGYSETGAKWQVHGVDTVRWVDIGETWAQAHAGQHSVEETPGVMRERMMQTLTEENPDITFN